MLLIGLSLAGLFSRTKNSPIRRFASSMFNPSTGALSLVNHLKGFAIATAIQQIPNMIWSFTQLWTLFYQAFITIYTFDWNRPDDLLDRQMKSQWIGFGNILGGTVGNALGWIACGAFPSVSLFAFDEKLALYVGQQVGEEFLEEIISNAALTIRYGLRMLIQAGFYETYKNVRRWLKEDDNPLIELILGRAKANEIKANWGEEGARPFTLYGAVDEKIETIDSLFWQNFAEELIDEFIDGCFEAGYVVAHSLDTYIAEQRLAKQQNEVVIVEPDRSNRDESIVLAGETSELKTAITTTLSNYQLMQGRDLGTIIGSPIDDYERPKELSTRIKFKLFSVPRPPYARTKTRYVREVTITLHNVDRTKLDWLTIKNALGGANGYLWGRFRGRKAVIGTGGKIGITVNAVSSTEAEQRINALALLTNDEYGPLNVTEQNISGTVAARLGKDVTPTQIYPGYMTIINPFKIDDIDSGRLAYDGRYYEKKYRFELWRDSPPEDYNELIAEIFRRDNPIP